MRIRGVAEEAAIAFGAAVDPDALRDEADYRAVLAAQFSMLTPENHMKWSLIHPERDRYDFGAADRIVAFARANGMAVRGHTLVWHMQNPAWLTEGSFTRDELIAILRDHISTVVGRYRGCIAQWDVVNEVVEADGSLRRSVWLDGIGPEYIDLAFAFAREADPGAKLFSNDYGAEAINPKSDAIFALVEGMRARGVPIDGVGLQAHLFQGIVPPMDGIAANMARIDGLGLEVAVTELDVAVKDELYPQLQPDQMRTFADVLRACRRARNCHTFVLWGVSDRRSWVPSYSPGFGHALLFDESMQPKDGWPALLDALAAP